MNVKRILSFVFLIGLIALAVYFTTRPSSTTLEANERDFAVEDTASVTKIFLANRASEQSLLERQEDGSWTLDGTWEVRQDAIDNLLATMKRLTVKAPVSKAMTERVLSNLVNQGIKVEVYQGSSKPSKVYYVGTANQDHSGTYMLLDGASKPFLMHIEGFHGFLSPRYIVRKGDWRKKNVFRLAYADIASVKMDYPKDPEKGFAIRALETFNDYALYDQQGNAVTAFDSTQVRSYLARFEDVNFEQFEERESEAFIDSVKASVPERILTVTDREGNTREVKWFGMHNSQELVDFEGNLLPYDPERLYIWINEDLFAIGQYFVFDNLDADLASFAGRQEL